MFAKRWPAGWRRRWPGGSGTGTSSPSTRMRSHSTTTRGVSSSARRRSPAIYAQLGGLEYIEEIGVPAIRAVTAALTEDLIARAQGLGVGPKVAARAEQRSAIVMLPAADPHAAV